MAVGSIGGRGSRLGRALEDLVGMEAEVVAAAQCRKGGLG
eukprot:CAMPEP_0194340436 /NCGR_PEP_ID=MMETSP0171-20130528/86330_1 /TAXON_ID=218684 /ORGANISM="Corethron pennatum, Strain L29A3" /LENGTH=39 /DNA_ID= /DNA_START= /DNA_END= /DNA_ORIENTATION=